jgi:signal transduction histidine kinase
VRNTTGDKAQRFDPGQALRAAVDLTHHAMKLSGINVRIRADGVLPLVTGHVGKFEQVLVNLLNNARDEGATLIALAAGPIELDGQRLLRVAVEDNGPGIPPHILPKLFQAFVTTKPRGKGTGLGLRICRRIIEEMQGEISAANRPEGGACFEILLPLDS